MPKVSIIMPVYNIARYLEQSIDSVLKQTMVDFEFLIINDGSIDNTDEIVKRYLNRDNRIVYLPQSKNNGLITCLNIGLQKSKGEFIARLDGDDLWLDVNKLFKQVKYLSEHSDCGLVGTFALVIDSTGKELYQLKYPTSDFDIRKRILINNCFIHSSVLFRKELAFVSGSYLKEERFVEDYGLWLRIGQIAKYYNLPDFMVGYRIQPDSITLKNNLKQIRNSIKLIQLNKKLYPNYYIGILKWYFKYFMVVVFGVKIFNYFKIFFLKKT